MKIKMLGKGQCNEPKEKRSKNETIRVREEINEIIC